MDQQKLIEAVFIVVGSLILAICGIVMGWLFLRQKDPQASILDVVRIVSKAAIARPIAILVFGAIYAALALLFPHQYAFGFFFIAFVGSVCLALGATGFAGYEFKDSQSEGAKSQRGAFASILAPIGVWFAVACIVEWLKAP